MAGISFAAAASAYSSQASSALSHRTYTYQEGRAKVTEHHYELPKGQHSNLVGSFSYRTVSPKAGQLKARIATETRKLKAQVIKDRKAGKINHKQRERIKGRLKYLQNQLNAEIASSPITRVVVHERDDDQDENAAASMEGMAFELLLNAQSSAAQTVWQAPEEAGPQE